MGELYTVDVIDPRRLMTPSDNLVPPINADQIREIAQDQFQYNTQQQLANALPLVLAAYPDNGANSLTLVTSPGSGAKANTKSTATLPVTLPGSDLLVEFSADISWNLPSSIWTTTTAGGGGTTATSSGGSSHSHSVSSTTASASGITISLVTTSHRHFTYPTGGSVIADEQVNIRKVDGSGNQLDIGVNSSSFFATSTVSSDVGTDAASATSHTHSVTGQTANAEAAHTHTVTLSNHTHSVTPSTAILDIKAELVIDGTVISAGLSQFHIEGFTGKSGVIQLRSIFIAKKDASTAALLASGQHDIGLKFTVDTTDFVATSDVTAKNLALIIRDASFDQRVQVFTP